MGIFFLGCGVTLYHGVHSLLHPEGVELQDIEIAGGVLLFSFLLEFWTLWIAYKAVDEAAIGLAVDGRALGLACWVAATLGHVARRLVASEAGRAWPLEEGALWCCFQ